MQPQHKRQLAAFIAVTLLAMVLAVIGFNTPLDALASVRALPGSSFALLPESASSLPVLGRSEALRLEALSAPALQIVPAVALTVSPRSATPGQRA